MAYNQFKTSFINDNVGAFFYCLESGSAKQILINYYGLPANVTIGFYIFTVIYRLMFKKKKKSEKKSSFFGLNTTIVAEKKEETENELVVKLKEKVEILSSLTFGYFFAIIQNRIENFESDLPDNIFNEPNHLKLNYD